MPSSTRPWTDISRTGTRLRRESSVTPAEEVVGHSIALLIPPELLGQEASIQRQIQNGKTVDHLETVRIRKDGERINVTLMIAPIRNEAGEILGATEIARDLTVQKQSADRPADTDPGHIRSIYSVATSHAQVSIRSR
jgi:PAS domain-containing protein